MNRKGTVIIFRQPCSLHNVACEIENDLLMKGGMV